MCALFGWLDYRGIVPYRVLRKLTQALANAAEEKVERKNSLCKIAQLIADSMQTQLITSDYQITDQYKAIHSQIAYTNDSLSSALWLV